MGVFLQTSCFGPDGHLAARRVLLGFFQLRASWFEAPTEDLTRIYSVWEEHGHGHGGRSLGERPKAFLGFICFYASQTGESVSGKKKVRRLSNLESRIQKSKTSLVPSPRNLEIMMANIDHRGRHWYQAFWFSRLFPLCSFTHSGNIKTGLIEFRNEE